MDKIRKERQRLWDTYIDLAATEATCPLYEFRGLTFHEVPGCEISRPYTTWLKTMSQSPYLPKSRKYLMQVATTHKEFYKGEFGESLLILRDASFVALRIGSDMLYVAVKPRDTHVMRSHARHKNLIYDLRNLELVSLKENSEGYDNVLIASF
jgi:hypothetical protein